MDADQDTPIMRLRSSKTVKKSVLEKADELLIFDDRIEDHSSTLFKRSQQSIRFDQVAQVLVNKGMVFAELVIESTGGGTITSAGLKKEEATRAKELIEKKAAIARAGLRGSSGKGTPQQQSVADQIRQLGELRNEGLLSDEEFEEKKRKLLDQI